jgi:hypothetical protein
MSATLTSETLNPQMTSRRDSIGATIGKRSIATLAPLSAMGGNNPSADLRDPSRSATHFNSSKYLTHTHKKYMYITK